MDNQTLDCISLAARFCQIGALQVDMHLDARYSFVKATMMAVFFISLALATWVAWHAINFNSRDRQLLVLFLMELICVLTTQPLYEVVVWVEERRRCTVFQTFLVLYVAMEISALFNMVYLGIFQVSKITDSRLFRVLSLRRAEVAIYASMVLSSIAVGIACRFNTMFTYPSLLLSIATCGSMIKTGVNTYLILFLRNHSIRLEGSLARPTDCNTALHIRVLKSLTFYHVVFVVTNFPNFILQIVKLSESQHHEDLTRKLCGIPALPTLHITIFHVCVCATCGRYVLNALIYATRFRQNICKPKPKHGFRMAPTSSPCEKT